MAKIGELYVAITADNSSLKTGLNESSNVTKNFVNNTIKDLAKLAVGYVSVKTAITTVWEETKKLSATTASVQAATQASAEEMAKFRDIAYSMADSLGVSADGAMQAIEALAKAGISTSDILGGALTGALTLAAAGSTDVGFAAETAASAMTQFGLSGKDVSHIADLLANGANNAQGEISDMAMALSQSGLVASQAGLSIEETVGSLTALASAGLLGSDAGTSLRNMLLRLTPTSDEAAKKMDELSISAFDQGGKFIGLAAYAGRLQDALKDMSAEQRQAALVTMFGTDSIRAANVMITQGEAGMRKWIDTVNESGTAQEFANTKLQSLDGTFQKTQATLINTATKFGEELTPAMTVTMEAVQGLAMALSGIVGVAGMVLDGINAVTGGMGGVVIAAGAVAIALNVAFGGLPALLGGIAIAVGLVVKGISDMVGANDKLKKSDQEVHDQWKKFADERSKWYQEYYGKAAKGASIAANVESEALKKLMQEYRDAGKTKLQLLDDEEKAALEKAMAEKATEADLAVIRKVYMDKRVALYNEDAEEAFKSSQERIKTAKEEAEKELEIERKKVADAGIIVDDGYEDRVKKFDQYLEKYGENTLELVDLDKMSIEDLQALNDAYIKWKEAKQKKATSEEIARIVEVTSATGRYFDYTTGLFDSLSRAASTFGNEALGEVLDGLSAMASSAGDATNAVSRIFASAGTDVGAWVDLVKAGIDFVSDTWDALFNNNSKKRKKEREEEKKAEEERLEAVAKLDEEYTKKTNSQLENLELERDKAIAEARRIGANVYRIEAYYAGEIAKLRDSLVDTSLEEARVKSIEDQLRAEYDARKAAVESQIRFDEASARASVDKLKKRLKDAKEWTDKYGLGILGYDEIRDAEKELNEARARLNAIVAQNNTEVADAFAELDEQMRDELGTIILDLERYQSRAAEASGNIGTALTDALIESTSEADFTKSIMDMLRKMAIDAAVLAGGFADQFKAIGVMIAEALKDGLQEAELTGIRGQISSLYGGATAAIADINKLFDIPGFAVGTNFAPGGMAVVGEYGPEIVQLPRGASVQTNAVSEAKMGNTINLTQNYYSPTAIDPVQADRMARRAMRAGVYAS